MCNLCLFDPEEFGNNGTNPPPQNIGPNSNASVADIIAAMNGSSWGNGSGGTTNITFTFDYIMTNPYGGASQELSAADQDSIKEMVDMYEAVANVSFTELTDGSKANINFNSTVLQGSVGGVANLPTSAGAGVWIDQENGPLGSGGQGGFSWFAGIHEFNHAMGMYHPFANGNPNIPKIGLDYIDNSSDKTVSAYKDGTVIKRGDVTGLLENDLIALWDHYGKNMQHEAGDNLYEFGFGNLGEALWDAAGNDTIKVADGVVGNSVIDLRHDGGFTLIGNDKIDVAYTAEIENAIGGQGNDTIYSNEFNNYLEGGAGSDTFILALDSSVDVIGDFDTSVDKIQFDLNGATVTNVDIVDGANGAILRVTDSNGTVHTTSVEGVSASQLTVGQGSMIDIAYSGSVTSTGSTTLPTGTTPTTPTTPTGVGVLIDSLEAAKAAWDADGNLTTEAAVANALSGLSTAITEHVNGTNLLNATDLADLITVLHAMDDDNYDNDNTEIAVNDALTALGETLSTPDVDTTDPGYGGTTGTADNPAIASALTDLAAAMTTFNNAPDEAAGNAAELEVKYKLDALDPYISDFANLSQNDQGLIATALGGMDTANFNFDTLEVDVNNALDAIGESYTAVDTTDPWAGGTTGTGGTGGTTGTGSTGGTGTASLRDQINDILGQVFDKILTEGTVDQLKIFIEILQDLYDAGYFNQSNTIEVESLDLVLETDAEGDSDSDDLFDLEGFEVSSSSDSLHKLSILKESVQELTEILQSDDTIYLPEVEICEGDIDFDSIDTI